MTIDPTRWITDDEARMAQGIGLWDETISPYRLIGFGILPYDGPAPDARARELRDYVLAACLHYHAHLAAEARVAAAEPV